MHPAARALFIAVLSALAGLVPLPVLAASLSISPILIEVPAPQQATTLRLQNRGDRPITGQVRVFAWHQANGEDVLEPTSRVVASPEIMELSPGTDYTVRLVRLDRSPPAGEETYRVVVDEVPDAAARRNGMIAFALRYIVPAFFFDSERRPSRLSWHIEAVRNGRYLVARNDGDQRARVSDLKLGASFVAPGLSGYVLGHSTRRWRLDGKATGRLDVSATIDSAPMIATATPHE